MKAKIPSAAERKRLLALQKQYSSLTAWRRVLPLFEKVVEEYKKAAAELGEAAIDASEVMELQMGLASTEGALQRLSKGDRSALKFVGFGVPGYPSFVEGYRIVRTFEQGILGGMYYSRGMDPGIIHAKNLPEFALALARLATAWGENTFCVEARDTNLPATFWEYDDACELGLPTGPLLPYHSLPGDDLLPDVPAPSPSADVVVRTFSNVPFYGVWEPVSRMEIRPAPIFSLRLRADPSRFNYETAGCMNYLHANSRAPTIHHEGDGFGGRGHATWWRLVWADDRYRDGSAPEEEAGYRFPPLPEDSGFTPPEPSKPHPYFGASTGVAKLSGPWYCESNREWTINMRVGDVFPMRSDGVLVVWIHASYTPPPQET